MPSRSSPVLFSALPVEIAEHRRLPKSGLERANPHFKSAGLSYNRANKQ
jgi:hypothetical protein